MNGCRSRPIQTGARAGNQPYSGRDKNYRAISTRGGQSNVPMIRVSARYGQLIRMCLRRGCSREDAKDLVQEAHLRWLDYERTARVRDADSLLRRILINLSITHYHRERTPPFTFEHVDRLDRGGMLIDPAPGPERTVAAEQELNGDANLLSAVSPRTCQIFIAQRGGYSYEEIADAYAIKPRTVEKHVIAAGELLTPNYATHSTLQTASHQDLLPTVRTQGDRQLLFQNRGIPSPTEIARREL